MGKKRESTATYFTVFVKFSRRVPNPVNIGNNFLFNNTC